MTTGPSAANLFGNSSKPSASSPPTAPETAPTCGNAPHPPTPTSHPDPSYSYRPSPNDSDGKPNTPPPNSPRTIPHPTKTVRQLNQKPREQGE